MNEYYKSVLDRKGGLITCGAHKGVMIAPENQYKKCPFRWVFLSYEKLMAMDTESALSEIVEAVRFVKEEID